ncbi:hypothetical protein PHYBLDRAFT_171169 [Phycomyces blakesleeanus NRRL 1555(-)]|uniref:Reverse transcriptase zinc-binding domain-containing protein n=1 Tax=Phycomyces blakesleeanus (strain ATCC 8743b / DSM 1359 / FGSC 10004 / NBRC 33097 / NRRL 1555) TaxID=763407 RepID=A0A167LGQ8_PHYB8|nr:hypothetical protein PHYBLDRAFT_171169 [Phycomyces blakesleeanus NRRL 1555(-)]OAD70417.1 hypothetical protein PHYBLDRAFT_171169 [Phycomyces blakesleeanus NRRL 1555(-)]|eukprot:XP_018288457.1 hypothetical protein PHYBLDRAFT_171169 [Phycomyces blakesleeanus NRRL 1555(-)]
MKYGPEVSEFSELWHVLRVVSVPGTFFTKVRSLMGRFLQHRTFPPVKLDTLCLPTKLGGLGVLNPKLQQGALQLRWLRPLFRSPSSPSGLVLPWLIHLLRHHLPDVHPLLPFVFPDLRHSRLRSYTSPFFNLFAACDLLPHDFDSTVVNLETCLDIPLASATIVPHGLPVFPSSWRHLRIRDAYEIDPNLEVLSRRFSSSFPRSPRILRNFFLRLDDHSLFLHTFVIRACLPQSILTAQFPDMMIRSGSEVDPSPLLSTLSPNFPWNRLSTRRYRSSCQVAIFSTEDMQQDIRAIEWRQFWSFVLPYASRNIWFRLLHRKISCRSALHHRVPTAFPSATCSLCGTTDESQDHFLFTCPLKLPLWETFWHTHFGFSPQTSDIHNALYKFTFPPPLDPTLEPASIFGSALLAVWRHHWAFVFDQAPFIATDAITTANSLLSRLHAEENLDQSPYPI